VKGLLRKIRGILRTAATWAIGWAGIGTAMGLLAGIHLRFLFQLVLGNAVAGGIVGGTFAVIVSVAEGRRTLEDLSLKRIALWGGLGSVVLTALPLGFGAPLSILLRPLLINGFLGAAFAAGTVAIAKQAPDRELLEEGDDPLLPGPSMDP
jgi:hypothetical protein